MFISPKTVNYNRKGEFELVEDGPFAEVRDYKLIINDMDSKEVGI